LEDVRLPPPYYSERQADKTTAPPQLSAAELRAQEDEAIVTVQQVIIGAVLLYLCMLQFALCIVWDVVLTNTLQHRLPSMLLRSFCRMSQLELAIVHYGRTRLGVGAE